MNSKTKNKYFTWAAVLLILLFIAAVMFKTGEMKIKEIQKKFKKIEAVQKTNQEEYNKLSLEQKMWVREVCFPSAINGGAHFVDTEYLLDSCMKVAKKLY